MKKLYPYFLIALFCIQSMPLFSTEQHLENRRILLTCAGILVIGNIIAQCALSHWRQKPISISSNNLPNSPRTVAIQSSTPLNKDLVSMIYGYQEETLKTSLNFQKALDARGGHLRFQIKMPTGKVSQVQFAETDTLDKIKRKIEQAALPFPIPPEDQRLVFAGKQIYPLGDNPLEELMQIDSEFKIAFLIPKLTKATIP